MKKLAAEMENRTSKHPITPGEVLPVDKLLGDMLLTLNKPAEALAAYELNVIGHPNRFNGLYGAALAAKGMGNIKKARFYYEKFLKITENGNSDRPELQEAKIFLHEKII